MDKAKFRISIIDFLPQHGQHVVGKDKNGEIVHFGDLVERYGENWFVAYRYGKIMLKQVGMMVVICNADFNNGDFSSVTKVPKTVAAGIDWLIIGYMDDPLYNKFKDIVTMDIVTTTL